MASFANENTSMKFSLTVDGCRACAGLLNNFGKISEIPEKFRKKCKNQDVMQAKRVKVYVFSSVLF